MTESQITTSIDWLDCLGPARGLSDLTLARWFYAGHKDPLAASRQAMRRAASRNHCELFEAMIQPPLDFSSGPLHEHTPGDDEPNYGAIEWAAKKRFSKPQLRALYVTACNGRRIRPQEASHDLSGVAELYLQRFRNNNSWISEDVLRGNWKGAGTAIPDALLKSEVTETAVEFIGRYSTDRLREIHRSLSHMPYVMY